MSKNKLTAALVPDAESNESPCICWTFVTKKTYSAATETEEKYKQYFQYDLKYIF